MLAGAPARSRGCPGRTWEGSAAAGMAHPCSGEKHGAGGGQRKGKEAVAWRAGRAGEDFPHEAGAPGLQEGPETHLSPSTEALTALRAHSLRTSSRSQGWSGTGHGRAWMSEGTVVLASGQPEWADTLSTQGREGKSTVLPGTEMVCGQ